MNRSRRCLYLVQLFLCPLFFVSMSAFAADPPQNCGEDASQSSFEVSLIANQGDLPYQFDSRFEFAPSPGVSQYTLEIIELMNNPELIGRNYGIDLDNNPPDTYRLRQLFVTPEGNIALSVGNGSGLNTPEDIARLFAIFESFTGRAIVSYPVEGEPIAAFDFDIEELTVQFDNMSSHTTCDPIGFEWDFGDGFTSSETDPTHAYASPGDYQVSLTVTDQEGVEDQASDLVEVIAPITAQFTYSADPANPLNVTFDGSASNSDFAAITDWRWDFGDGEQGIDTNSSTATYTYQQAGTFDVTLVVEDALGNDGEVTMPVNVDGDLPVAVPVVERDPDNPLRIIFNGDGSFDPDDSNQPGDGINSWFWTLGDGSESTDVNFDYSYSQIDVYDASLLVVDNEGDESEERFVVDLTYDITADIDYSETLNLGERQFSAAGSTTHPGATIVVWNWDFADGNTASGISPTHQFEQEGTYLVSLEVIDNYGQANQTIQPVTIDGSEPVAIIEGGLTNLDGREVIFDGSSSYDPDDGTSPGVGIVSWSWDLGDGATASTPGVTYTYAADGEYTTTLTVTDDEGEASSVSRTVVVDTEEQDGFIVRYKGKSRQFGMNMSVSHELEVLDADGPQSGKLNLTSKFGNAVPLIKGALCGVEEAGCIFSFNEDSSEVSLSLDIDKVAELSCEDFPNAEWCNLSGKMSNELSNLARTVSSLKMAAEPFRSQATLPPGGGLPGYNATPGESKELRTSSAKINKSLGQITRANTAIVAIFQWLESATFDGGDAIPTTEKITLHTGEQIGITPDGMLVPDPGGPMSEICDTLLAEPQTSCIIDLPILIESENFSWDAIQAGMEEPVNNNQDRLAANLLRKPVNKAGKQANKLVDLVNKYTDAIILDDIVLSAKDTKKFEKHEDILIELMGGFRETGFHLVGEQEGNRRSLINQLVDIVDDN